MTKDRFTPEEFARLAALPPDDPERVRAEADPRFEAWRRMLHAFESGAPVALDAAEARAADAELERRLAREIGIEPGANARSAGARPAAARGRGGGFRWKAWRLTAWAPAAAFAAVLVVAGGLWMVAGREPAGRVVRGGDAGRPALAVTIRAAERGSELSWAAVPGADRYDVTFSGGDLSEIARVEGHAETTLLLREGALPAGLTPGQEVVVEVIARRGADVLARSRAATMRLP